MAAALRVGPQTLPGKPDWANIATGRTDMLASISTSDKALGRSGTGESTFLGRPGARVRGGSRGLPEAV